MLLQRHGVKIWQPFFRAATQKGTKSCRMGRFSIRSFVPPSSAQEPARQASDPARQASEPASQASEPANQASEPARQASEPVSQASEALRPAWLALRPGWMGLRPAWLALGPSRGERTDGHTYVRTCGQKISSFYRTSSPIGAAALLHPNFN